jgi:hypothetical protein
MIIDPSEKDDIYLNNVAKIGNSEENIQYIQNVLSEEEHKIILDYVKNNKGWRRQPWDSESVFHDDLPEEVVKILNKVFTLAYEKSTNLYGVEINPVDKHRLNLVKFKQGMFLDAHVDTLSSEENHIAVIYYINDDYIGGEICFPKFNLNIKPEPNSLIFFPGNEGYVHEVSTIFKGDRYSSTIWFQFTGSTFNKNKEWYG